MGPAPGVREVRERGSVFDGDGAYLDFAILLRGCRRFVELRLGKFRRLQRNQGDPWGQLALGSRRGGRVSPEKVRVGKLHSGEIVRLKVADIGCRVGADHAAGIEAPYVSWTVDPNLLLDGLAVAR